MHISATNSNVWLVLILSECGVTCDRSIGVVPGCFVLMMMGGPLAGLSRPFSSVTRFIYEIGGGVVRHWLSRRPTHTAGALAAPALPRIAQTVRGVGIAASAGRAPSSRAPPTRCVRGSSTLAVLTAGRAGGHAPRSSVDSRQNVNLFGRVVDHASWSITDGVKDTGFLHSPNGGEALLQEVCREAPGIAQWPLREKRLRTPVRSAHRFRILFLGFRTHGPKSPVGRRRTLPIDHRRVVSGPS